MIKPDNLLREVSERLPKTIELSYEEMDWLDCGNGFCALDNRYVLTLAKKEISIETK